MDNIYLSARPGAAVECRLLQTGRIVFFSALSLFVIRVLGADDHYLAVSFDDFAFVAHGFYGSTNFHKKISLIQNVFFL